ncbi:fibronectin type III domain-containing protein [Aquisphaera giovannonii]|uniref:fibronectin type III domain-containing protein n=1 Tax=Aquisphaera giovannonii TaxID=406548 RepID=UPI00143D7372|nr:fibronectin type III domain-containing protein [Aquisphaera giovannonii]
MEDLEPRLVMSAGVLTYHNDIAGTGVNAAEVNLTPANVKVGSFGKLLGVNLDGQVYAQPLVDTGVTIVAGPNTTAGSAGVHDVVFVATEHDSLYALDASNAGGGAVLWRRSFLDPSNPGSGSQPDINNTLGATAITSVPNGDLGSSDISPEVGITGTPVIDPSTNTLYVVTKTKETIGTGAHYVQRLHAINIADGTDRVTPYLIGDTRLSNNTQIYVYGTGDGSVVDPYNGTGRKVVQFNAQREAQRMALSLVNGSLYASWASHGDNGPYHGFVTRWDVSNLANGMPLTGVLCVSPNDGEAGLWEGGGRLSFEANGSAFYFETGNGTGGAPALDAGGFPADANYNEALVKVVNDPASTPTGQNPNGWGMKVADYFIPYNVAALDAADQDFGSGGPLILPDSAGIPGHPHLIVAAGKQGKIYLIDRDNMGKYNATNDNVLNAVVNGSGNSTPPVQIGGSLSTPAYFNGALYWVSGYNSTARAYRVQSNGSLGITSVTAVGSFGYLPGSVSVSADGTSNGIVWIMDRNANLIRAYDATTLATELWDSGQKSGGADSVGAVVKFATPTIANGQVFVGTTSGLVVYGLTPPAGSAPSKPTNLQATTLSGSSVKLTWQDPTTAPNTATGYSVLESVGGGPYTEVTTAPAGATGISVGGLQPNMTYSFEVRGFNGVGSSPPSDPVTVSTTNVIPVLDFSAGFAGAASKLTLNGSTSLVGTRLELTNGGKNQAASAFSTSPVDVTKFTTQFTFQVTAGAGTADGFTFCIQSKAPTSLGSTGAALGYGPYSAGGPGGIPNSVAIKFDLYSNQGEGVDSTGLYTGGASPTNAGSINLAPSGVDLHSGDVMQVEMTYDGTTLTVVIRDTQTGKSATQAYTINIPSAVGGSTAYAGFTAGTGGLSAKQDIITWSFAPNAPQAPSAPSGLGASPATDTSVSLAWANNATNQAGFHLDRATDSGFTQNLITQTIASAAATGFIDAAPGIAPGGTYYYRIRAFNTAGDSANSNTASVAIPLAPPKPSDAAVVNVGTGEVDLTWTDNAGRAATSYIILRQANGSGGFTQVATLPALNATPPSTYPTWADTNVVPGTFYEYHVQAINTSGHNDFTGTNATTITLPPSGLTAKANGNGLALTWTAPAAYGTLSYNVYRSTTPGGEGTTPLAAGLATTAYIDASATPGVTYYYEVTAVNANATRTPPLPAESAPSAEASASLAATAPAAPTGLTSSVPFNTPVASVLLSWTASAGAAGYNVYRSLSSGGETGTPIATMVTGTSFTDAAAAFGVTYFYKVTAVNSGGESAKSGESHAMPLFLTHVNFTTANGLAVADYLADTGLAYSAGTRANGLQYGWNVDNTANARDRNAVNSPDELHDSLGHMQKPGNTNAWWGIAVPNGIYSVHLIAGDPTAVDSVFRINVGGTLSGGVVTGGTLAINGTPAASPNSAHWVENTVTVTVTGGVLYVSNAAGAANNKIDEIDVTQVLPGVDFDAGFTSTAGLTLNGGAYVKQVGTALQLTDGGRNEAASAFTTNQVYVAGFSTSFRFQLSSGNTLADGFTFCIQGNAPTALGATGSGLGYGAYSSSGGNSLSKSVAIKFDLYSNQGEGSNSIGVFTGGAPPTVGGLAPQGGMNNLNGTGIDLHSGHVFDVTISYDGSLLTVKLSDAATGASITRSYAVDIVTAVGGNLAYVGFTAGTGSLSSTQDILNWTFSPDA